MYILPYFLEKEQIFIKIRLTKLPQILLTIL